MLRAVQLLVLGFVALALNIELPVLAQGQTTPPASPPQQPQQPQTTPPSTSSEGPSDAESNVGYVDSAIPLNALVVRFDSAYGANRPSRAEYFYAKPGVLGGNGPLLPEARIDYQELTTHLEIMPVPGYFSAYVEMPYRWVNPEFNRNENGLGDVYGGCKWVFIKERGFLATFQLLGSIPTRTGPALGTYHYSLEPGLLMNYRLLEGLTLETELRYWIPLGGTDFAGDIIRYGIGISYGNRQPDTFWLAPVVECVGWTVLGGKEMVAQSPTDFAVVSATGDTIVNIKAGVRAGLGQGDIYVGYGHALTDDRWYRDILRFELRLRF